MITLSLFDGMSCGQVAGQRAGLEIERYYASEVDKYPRAVAQHRYPETIQLGDVRNIDPVTLPKIDLLMGGSPCQGFSRAGKRKFFDDPRSQLFFEFVRILNAVQPKWFLFENVVMKKEIRDVISKHFGVEPVMIDSALVSAQNRKRLYWTNIPFDMPRHRGIIMNDILDNAHSERTKSYCLDANYDKTSKSNPQCYLWKGRRQIVFELPHGYNSV